MMNWRDILYVDLWSLLRGDRPPRKGVPIWARWLTGPTARELVFRIRRRSWRGPWYVCKAAWHRDLIHVTNQLAAIVRCNAPIIEGLEAAALDAPNPRLEDVFLALREDIASGLTIAQAMAARPRFFPRYYVDLVKAGEETGTLYERLDSLRETIARARSFGEHIRGWIAYLVLIVTLQCLFASFLMVQVVPMFVAVLEDFGSQPPRSSQALIDTSNWMIEYWPIVAACVGAILVLWRLTRWFQRRRGLFDRTLGGLSICSIVLRGTVAKRNLGHIAAVLDALLAGGVPLDTALDDAASLDINPIYADLVRRVHARVRAGQTLRDALARERLLVPRSFRALVSVGESSGLLPEAFGRIGGLYKRDVLKRNKILADTLGPLVVFVLGGLTLFVYGSVFVMIVSMTESILATM